MCVDAAKRSGSVLPGGGFNNWLSLSMCRTRRGLPTSVTGLVEPKRILVPVSWGRRGRTWLGAPVRCLSLTPPPGDLRVQAEDLIANAVIARPDKRNGLGERL